MPRMPTKTKLALDGEAIPSFRAKATRCPIRMPDYVGNDERPHSTTAYGVRLPLRPRDLIARSDSDNIITESLLPLQPILYLLS